MKYMKRAYLLSLLLLIWGLMVPGTLSAALQYGAFGAFGAFDPPYWNGLVILEKDTAFAFRFVIHKAGDSADGYDTFHIVERPGPFSPDGKYAEVSFNPSLPFHDGHKTPIPEKNTDASQLVRLRYAQYGNGLVGCVHIPENISIEILFYNPWIAAANYREAIPGIVGECKDVILRFVPVGSSFAKIEKKDNTLSASIDPQTRVFYFYAGFEGGEFDTQKIAGFLDAAMAEYQNTRPRVSGQWQGLVASISDNLAWMKLYQPDKKRVYLPAGRRWMFPDPDGKTDLWTIFEWDAFFNALEASVEDVPLAKSEIEAVLDCQYPTGNIPNWRSAHSGCPDRSQPPVGAFAVLKTYYKTNDQALLANSYDRLKKWHEYWIAPGINGNPRRDGNEDGLLEWGSDTDLLFPGMPEWEKGASGTQRAAWESGQDDLPNFDNVPFDEKKNTLTMNCIDLSSLYALDAEMMMRIAVILGKKEDADTFKKEYEDIKHKINRVLWNGDFYFDRYWGGAFSVHKAASNFYPLTAGVPEAKQVEGLLRHLRSETEFWGAYVLPTISRDNPAFKDQQYWRGTIWPPTNYMVYQGLKRYKLDEIASEFAVKSAALFLSSWHTYGLCRENYDSVTGSGGGQRYQSWGPLFALVLLEDFIDITPFEGLRVGNLSASGQNKIENLRLQTDVYSLETGSQRLFLVKNRKEMLEFKGKAVLRHIEAAPGLLSFEAHVIGDAVDVYPLLFQGKGFSVESRGQKVIKKNDFLRIPGGITQVIIKSSR